MCERGRLISWYLTSVTTLTGSATLWSIDGRNPAPVFQPPSPAAILILHTPSFALRERLAQGPQLFLELCPRRPLAGGGPASAHLPATLCKHLPVSAEVMPACLD